MKENSIEEDIIKKFEKFCENLYVFKDDDMGGHFEKIVGNQRANTTLGYLVFKENLEEKLSDYKRVLKENEELKKFHIQDNKHLDFIMQHSIPIQKVKDKIEELKQKAISYGPFIDRDESFNIESKISILQELLEGRK